MTIKGRNEETLVNLPGFWETLAKLSFAASVPVLMLGVSWAVWVTTTVNGHTTELAVLRAHFGKAGITQSVNVSEAGKAAVLRSTGRDYLTVAEVAEREGVAERTVVSWIESNRFLPVPQKLGKEWTFAADYRLLPQAAAGFRTLAHDRQTEEDVNP